MRRFLGRLRRFFWPKGYYIVVPPGATLYLSDVQVDTVECAGMMYLGGSHDLGSISVGPPDTTTGNAGPLSGWPKTLSIDLGIDQQHRQHIRAAAALHQTISRAKLKRKSRRKKRRKGK